MDVGRDVMGIVSEFEGAVQKTGATSSIGSVLEGVICMARV